MSWISRTNLFYALFAIVQISSCNWVKTPSFPLGETWESTEIVEGSWIECWEKDKDNLFELEDKKSIVENQIVFVRAIGEGKLVVGCTEWDATTGEFKTKTHKVFLAKANGIKLAFCETGSADGYWFVRYDFRDNELLDVYLPKFGFFHNAITTEKSAGQVVVRSKDEVGCVIEVKAMIEMLESEKSSERLFQSSPISVYRRLGQKDGREKVQEPKKGKNTERNGDRSN